MSLSTESLTPESSNIASIPFVAMALQTQEEINASYLRKMNRDYASHIPSTDIPNLYAASESHLSNLQNPQTSSSKTDIE